MNKTFKLTSVFVLALLFTTFSCSSDDEVTEINIEDFNITIDENPTNGQSVGTVQTDGDRTLSFSIASQTPEGALEINTSTGELTITDATLFDFETNPVITAIISVVDTENTGTVTISLNDLNEIGIQNFTTTIDENPTNGQSIGTLQVDGNGPFTFSVDSQTPEGALEINTSTGELTVADATLFDFETNPVITATSSLLGALNTGTVTINLNDINEISLQDLIVAIDENPTNGQTIATVQADSEGPFTFSIASQTPAGALDINSNTGELTVADAILFDFETNPIIMATISIDGAINTSTVTVNLNDLDEISAQDVTLTIDENPIDGQVIGSIQVEGGGTLSFSITSQTPTGAVNINASTGELTVVDPNLFDFEINPVITVNISVNNSVNTVMVSATINLNDIDEISVQDLTVAMDENPIDGQVVGTIQASSSGNLSFAITFQNPAGALEINASTGELTVADAALFDFETNPSMFAVISVDNGVNTVTVNATISINDLVEAAVIGDFRDGGVVFWVDPTDNTKGLVCTISDQSNSAEWGCFGVDIPTASGSIIGSGEANTVAIEALCTTPGTAADLASNLTLNGFDDWFLPSHFEWNEMYANKVIVNATAVANGGGNITDDLYWTSTQLTNLIAFSYRFTDGLALTELKSSTIKVRAVREFE